ncbi:MAG: type II toxin-antitoxin system VapC family toxin [Nitrospirae bacterium]|nr:type II toxin-antitoxin system VapC family toxin [Nitrospirota bacterium]
MSGERRASVAEDRKRAVIDTNLLVRYLTGDDPSKANDVKRLLLKAAQGEIRLLIPSIVIAELVWILQSFYKLERSEIVPLLNAILHTHGVEVSDKGIVSDAIAIYRDEVIDFIDAWIVAFAKTVEVRAVYTFDRKHFKGIDGIDMLHP